jgi:hypothetical protein
MPTETVIVISGVALMFIVFAGALMWGDWYSHQPRS